MTSAEFPDRSEKRSIPLAGANNFRDMGGYKAADGRQVKWSQVYRSGQLSGLTDEDCAKIKDLNIVSVIDLRRSEEREHEPSRWHADHSPQVHTAPHPQDGNRGASVIMGQMVKSFDDSRGAMVQTYWNFPVDQAPHYRKLFESLADRGACAVLFHCAAGKDRTGLGAALILSALGVDQEQIFEDYLLSNTMFPVEEKVELITRMLTEKYGVGPVPPEAMRPIVCVDPDYLNSALKRIEQDWGDVETYLREALGVDDAKRDSLRASLLE